MPSCGNTEIKAVKQQELPLKQPFPLVALMIASTWQTAYATE